MVGEGPSRVSDIPPSANDVGNHHWPEVANYFAEHGDQFLPHHSHSPVMLFMAHCQRGFDRKRHDECADYHEPREVPGCRSKPVDR